MRVAGEHWATPDGAAYDGVRLGETVERPDAGREVVQSGEVFEVAAVATEQDVSEVGEAVDVLFDRSKGFRILGGDVAALKTWLEQTLVQITSSSSCSADSESI